MTHHPLSRSGLWPAVLVCAVVGVITVAATVSRGRATSGPAATADAATEDYGRQLVAQTSLLLGPDQPDPARRYSGSRLACGSCHLGTGTEPGTLTLLQTTEHFPRFSGRVGDMTDIEDRINECMQRSMNGRPLPADSVEMRAMAAYLRSLGGRYAAMGAAQKTAVEPAPFKAPARAASLEGGKAVFDARCAICHGADGLGLPASANRADGYVFPPLWGPDSFNDGAGMHRLIASASFIRANMPFGTHYDRPQLSAEDAWDVAAYINSQPRPKRAGLDRDYPDRARKPVDAPFAPHLDSFPLEQHKYGPFQPILDAQKAASAAPP